MKIKENNSEVSIKVCSHDFKPYMFNKLMQRASYLLSLCAESDEVKEFVNNCMDQLETHQIQQHKFSNRCGSSNDIGRSQTKSNDIRIFYLVKRRLRGRSTTNIKSSCEKKRTKKSKSETNLQSQDALV